jgi:PAS domain S-box-containing protein
LVKNKVRTLYVDDEPSLLDVTKLFLEREGLIHMETAESAELAAVMLSNGTFDVVISDYMMPGMNGIELLKALRSNGDMTPYIIFTGRGREEVAIEALNNGADFYLQKGGDPRVQFGELKNAILQLYQRHTAEKALKGSLAALRATLESTTDGIMVFDKDRNLTHYNQKLMDMWNVPKEMREPADLRAHHFAFSQIDANPCLGEMLARCMDKPEQDGHEIVHLVDGRIFEVFCTPQLIDHTTFGQAWSFRDITERYRAEETLRASEERYRRLIESSIEGVWVLSREHTITFINERGAEMLGYTEQDIVGRSPLEFMDETWRHRFVKSAIPRQKGHRVWEECIFRHRDGSEVCLTISATPMVDEQGQFAGALAIVTDMGPSERAEEGALSAADGPVELNTASDSTNSSG